MEVEENVLQNKNDGQGISLESKRLFSRKKRGQKDSLLREKLSKELL